MIATGRVAYAHARVRALKSQLFGAEMIGRLRAARDSRLLCAVDGEAAGDVDVRTDGADLSRRRFRHLVACYRVVLTSYPSGQPLCLALLRLHEIENLKLVWRARARSHPFDRWGALWRPLGTLERIHLETCRDQTSLLGLVASVRATPYGEIADATLRAHADDLLACDLALDRWSSASLLEAADGLGHAEAAARALALCVVRERDLSLLRRGASAFGLSTDAVIGSLVLLPRELSRDELTRLATWSRQEGSLVRTWPRAWRPVEGSGADWDSVLLSVRRARRHACRRAFLGSPYCVAPAVALLLLQEEEVRGIVSIQESAGYRDADLTLERVLVASAMGT